MKARTATSADLRRRDLMVWLAGLTGLSIGAASVTALVHKSQRGRFAASGLLLPDLKRHISEVARIEIIGPKGQLDMVRSGTGWAMANRDGYKVSETALARLIDGLTTARISRRLPADTLSDRPAMGGSEAGIGTRIVLRDSAGKIVSDLIVSQRGRMVLAEIAETTDLLQTDLPADLASDQPASWLSLNVFDIPPEQIATARLIRPGQPDLDIIRRPDGGFGPVGGTPSAAATDIALVLSNVSPVDVMASERLTGPVLFGLETRLKSGLLIVLTGVEARGMTWTRLDMNEPEAASQEIAQALRARTQGWAFAVPALVARLLATPTALVLNVGTGAAASD